MKQQLEICYGRAPYFLRLQTLFVLSLNSGEWYLPIINLEAQKILIYLSFRKHVQSIRSKPKSPNILRMCCKKVTYIEHLNMIWTDYKDLPDNFPLRNRHYFTLWLWLDPICLTLSCFYSYNPLNNWNTVNNRMTWIRLSTLSVSSTGNSNVKLFVKNLKQRILTPLKWAYKIKEKNFQYRFKHMWRYGTDV